MNFNPEIFNIAISALLHDNKKAHIAEGYGEKPVFEWPIYHFFSLYHSGKKNEAQQLFEQWYLEQYQKYSDFSKSKGGMKKGSLDLLYETLNNDTNSDNILTDVVKRRVNQRFLLLENIQKSGYRSNKSDPVKAYKHTDNRFILFGGHHRVAILAVLGYNRVPDVFIFNNKILYSLFRIQKKLKSFKMY